MIIITNKTYNIFLGSKKIGTTQLEKGDPFMSTVYGAIKFINSNIGYDFFKEYSKKRQIEIAIDYPDDKIISIRTKDNLRIINDNGIEIKGAVKELTGMAGNEYFIAIEGIPYSAYEEEFPHHFKPYVNIYQENED